jgi:hypothetical protein
MSVLTLPWLQHVSWGRWWSTLLQQWLQITLLQQWPWIPFEFVIFLVALLTSLPVIRCEKHIWNFSVLEESHDCITEYLHYYTLKLLYNRDSRNLNIFLFEVSFCLKHRFFQLSNIVQYIPSYLWSKSNGPLAKTGEGEDKESEVHVTYVLYASSYRTPRCEAAFMSVFPPPKLIKGLTI